MELLDFQLVLLLELLETKIGCGLVVTHVIVPSTGELEELGSLRALNRYQFLLLRLSHVLELTQHLFVLEVIEFELSTASFGQVHRLAASLTIIIQESIRNALRKYIVSTKPHLAYHTCKREKKK